MIGVKHIFNDGQSLTEEKSPMRPLSALALTLAIGHCQADARATLQANTAESQSPTAGESQEAGNADPDQLRRSLGLPKVIPEHRLVYDEVSGNYFRLSPEEFALWEEPEPTPPRPVSAVPKVQVREAADSRQYRFGGNSIGATRIALAAASTLTLALVATLLGYAVSRLLSQRAAAWPVVMGAFVSCWLLATCLDVLWGSVFFSVPRNLLGVIAALGVLAALVFVSFGRRSASAEKSDQAALNAIAGETIAAERPNDRRPAATLLKLFAKVLGTIVVLLFVVGIWRGIERDLGYPLGAFWGGVLRGGVVFLVLAWIWGLPALIGSHMSGRSRRLSPSAAVPDLKSSIDQPFAPATIREGASDAVSAPTNDAFQEPSDGVESANPAQGQSTIQRWISEFNEQRDMRPVVAEVAEPTQATTPQPVLKADEENAMYEKAWNEISSGAPVTAIWARAYAESEGDEARTRAAYIRLRVANWHSGRKATS